MISVETTNPVFSNAIGKNRKVKSDARETRKEARDLRRSGRKAKRNAPKLKKIRRKSGKTSFVMKLIKLVPVGLQRFSGIDAKTSKADLLTFQRWVINTKGDKVILGKGGSTGFGDDGVFGTKSKVAWDKYGTEYKSKTIAPTSTATAPTTATASGTDYQKTFQDGSTITIPASDVIVNSSGVFDKSDIAKAMGVTKEQVTPAIVDKALVYIAPVSATSDVATETQKSATSDVAIEIPTDKVVETPEGTFLSTDTQSETEPIQDIAIEQKQEQAPLKKYEKIILWGGVAVVVLIIGVVAYRKFSKGK